MGRIGQAIELTNKCFSGTKQTNFIVVTLILIITCIQSISFFLFLFAGLLESNQNLLFMLKCRQFVEMVNGSDLDVMEFLLISLSSNFLFLK